MLKNYFKTAWRNLLRGKLFSFINIAGLSVGLACCMLIVLYAKDEVSYDRFHDKAPQLYRLTRSEFTPENKLEYVDGNTGMVQGPNFKREVPEVKDFVRVQSEHLPIKIGTHVFEEDALYTDENFFSVFSFPMKSGDPKTALVDPNSVVLNEEIAKKLFGKTDVIGEVLELPLGEKGSFEPFKVTGIVPKSPQNSSIKISILLPMKLNMRDGKGDMQWLNFYLNTFVLLDEHADIARVETKFKQIYESTAATEIADARKQFDMKNRMEYHLQPLLDMHLSKECPPSNGLVDASNPIYTRILGSIAIFILIIACINFINLTIARSLKRAKEIGIRKAIGGDRKQLIIQFLGETFFLAFCSFLFAVILLLVFLPYFNTLSNKALSFTYLLDAKLVIGYFLLFVGTSVIAGLYPALQISRFDPVESLYNRSRMLTGKNILSKGLVVLQFALASFLIVATITIYSQFSLLTNQDLGYKDKDVVLLRSRHMNASELSVLKTELKKSPDIEHIAARQGGNWYTIAKADGKDMNFAMEVYDTSLLATYQLQLAKGRNLSPSFPSDSTQSILINEAFAKEAGWNDPIGKQVDFFYDSIKYNVVGVVKDYHFETLLNKIRPMLFVMHPKYNYGELIVKLKPGNHTAAIDFMEKVFKKEMPFMPFKYDFKETLNRAQYESEEKWKQIILFAALLTIFISCIGLFGLATLAAEKRVKEIGIRKVLGASVSSITTKLSGSFVKLVLISVVIAFPCAWWAMNKWLENYPVRIHLGVSTFLLATLVVVGIAILTVSYQAIKAAVANPVKSLRTE